MIPLQPSSSPFANLHLFHSDATELLKFDFTFEAGALYQPCLLCAGAANQLFPVATVARTAQQLAEFFDYRGIVLEPSADTYTANLSIYTLRKYAGQLFPVVAELFQSPAFPQEEFDRFCRRRRQQLSASFQKTAYVARNLFYKYLYGPEHILGQYACPDDVDKLSLGEVVRFYQRHYSLPQAHLLVSGNYDDALLSSFSSTILDGVEAQPHPRHSVIPVVPCRPVRVEQPLKGAVQASIRIGRLIPLRWDDPDYARFMVLNTILGGYFGSRLMSNIREDKGYTYGIYSQTHIYRDSIIFSITADVGNDVRRNAVEEIYKELHRLQTELVGDAELEMVRHYMEGDFIRSIDGVFEVGERYRQMFICDIDERFTDNYFDAVRTVTPDELLLLARRYLSPDAMTEVVVGGE